MHQPRLHSSQELTLHQVTVDQSYRIRQEEKRLTSNPSTAVTTLGRQPGLPSRLTSSAALTGGLALAQAPGGSSSTASASIVRPEVRHRTEWISALETVEPYVLPTQQILRESRDNATVQVRYIADDYDRRWLAGRLEQYGSDLIGGLGRGGKTGKVPVTQLPLSTAVVPRKTRATDISLSVLEDLMTAFELAAYYNAEVPLEKINAVDHVDLDGIGVSSAIESDVRQYWLQKRQSLGGNIACIPALRAPVREDYQNALCHPEILGDCPLPFKYRDWSVPTIIRKRRREPSVDGESALGLPTADQLALVDSAVAISVGILQRERIRFQHTAVSLYELALLREVGSSDARS